MKEELLLKTTWFKIGKKKYDVTRISAERALKASALFNKIDKGVYDKKTDKYLKYESEYLFVKELLSVVLLLINIDFKITRMWEWFRRRMITKRHILKTIDYKIIMDLIEEALLPIIGEKKKDNRKRDEIDGGNAPATGQSRPRSFSSVIAELCCKTGYSKEYCLKEMTIDEIIFFWECGFKAECLLRGIPIEEKGIEYDDAKSKVDDLNKLYGDLNG